MLRTVYFSILVLTLTKQSVISHSPDGGFRYLTKHLNMRNVSSPIRGDPSHQLLNTNLEAIPVQRTLKAPALVKIPLPSRNVASDPPSFQPTVSSIPSTYTQKKETLVDAEKIQPVYTQNAHQASYSEYLSRNAHSENVKGLSGFNLHEKSEEKPVQSTVQTISYTQETTTKSPFVISVASLPKQEISMVAPKFTLAPRQKTVEFPRSHLPSEPVSDSTAVPSCPFAPTQHTEETTSTTTTTTTRVIPTTQRTTTTSTTPTTTPVPSSSCINGEIFPTNTGSCDQFLMCHNSVIVLMICPQGMGFNFKTNRCDWSVNVQGCGA
ncbi:histone H3.v1-like [Battus philenor]|uniref:histone H3.v1-like n=1 Tax=Battus philenor TaxID=42288 RepID=UPI0035CF4410